jgi:hypothetical protein
VRVRQPRYRWRAQVASGAAVNAIAEQIVSTIRTECLDHLIVVDVRHLRAVLAGFRRFTTIATGYIAAWPKTPSPVMH